MRAVFVREFGSLESLSLHSAPDPIPDPDDVVVDVQATAANFDDLLVIGGKYQFLPALPFIPGKLSTGKIASIGSNMLRDCQAIGRIVLLPADDGAKSAI